ncbi:GAF and ANTAR domain-containing protein [Georgenia wangjunii]|uniref:GAF and ANTAR domain-containing protein n=1 Tax=Georgenia wangjunii TaxID=3117730 RepID=UPI002F266F30
MTQALPLADELAVVYARMSGLLLSEETVGSALRLVTSLAVEVTPSAVGSGVTLLDVSGERTTTAATDRLVEVADALQYDLEEGPCLDAWQERRTVRVDDVRAERRWPRWSQGVAGTGIRSCLSAGLVAGDEALGAIKVYSTEPDAFDARSEHLLTMFAAQAAVLVANVRSAEDARRMSDELKDALRARDSINVAKGVLMAKEGLGEEDAFAMLLGLASREHRTVRDVALSVVRSTGRPRR